jgi:hypothetical protein
MTRTLLIAALAIVATSGIASAYDGSGSSIDRRQAIQEQRIQQGVRSGEISHREYRQLEVEQARIRHMERMAKRDGHVDRWEAAQIRSAQNGAARHIRAETHDNETRWNSGWRRW